MPGLVEGKVMLVTGGGSGIGRATALKLAQEGATVMIADYVQEGGERTVKMIKDSGGTASFIPADVSLAAQVEAMVAKTVQTYGRIDGAFNNAGIEGRMATTVETTEENFDRTIAINLKGVWLCMKYEIPQMLKQGGGSIVNTASISGVNADYGLGPYNIIKAAVINMTRSTAIDYARKGIRCNAGCPGSTATPGFMRTLRPQSFKEQFEKNLPIGRFAQPGEIANMMLFLASDESSYVSGVHITADAGFTAHSGNPYVPGQGPDWD